MPRSHFDGGSSFDENRKRISHAALEYFTNRKRSIDAFTDLANTPQGSPLKLLSFCGLGGIGKTALLAKLAQELDKNPSRFHGAKLPHARFDFKGTPVDASLPALLGLRVGLGQTKGISFPRFDPMLAMMIASSGAEAPPLVKVNARLSFFYQLSKGVGGVAPGGGLVTGALGIIETVGKKIGDKAAEHNETAHDLIRKAGGTDKDYQLYAQVQAGGPELQEQLIWRFAADLKESLDKVPHDRPGFACRAVIFLDTYEHLGIGGAAKDSARYSEMETWVRRLVADCLAIGVLPVISGRDHLRQRWHEKEPREDWADAIDEHRLGGLSRRDAHHFLHSVGIGEAPPQDPADNTIRDALQRAIIECCPEYEGEDAPATAGNTERGCHPLALALCAEIVLNSRADPKILADPSPDTFRHIPPGKELNELTDRFLNSLNDTDKERWLTELSLTPRFDADAALEMAKARRRDQNRTAWEVLTLYSFMEAQPDGFWRLHNLMAECLSRRVPPAEARAVHEFFKDYWQTHGEAALAFYHQWALDPQGTLDEWFAHQEAARTDIKRIPEARQLLTLWSEITLDEADRRIGDELWAKTHIYLAVALQETSQITLGSALLSAIEHYQLALRVFTQANYPESWAMTSVNLGAAYSQIPIGNRLTNLKIAITFYEAALSVYKEDRFPYLWAHTKNCLGVAYRHLPTDNRDKNLEIAIQHHQDALRVVDESDSPVEWAKNHVNLGNCFSELDSMSSVASISLSIECFEAALRVYTQDAYPMHWAGVQNNLGRIYGKIKTGNHTANIKRSIEYYEAALQVFTEETFPVEWAMAKINIGQAHLRLSAFEGIESLLAAFDCFRSALLIYTEMDFPHEWAKTHFNLGLAWLGIQKENQDLNALQSAYECFANAQRGFLKVGIEQDAHRAQEWAEKIESELSTVSIVLPPKVPEIETKDKAREEVY